MLALDSAAVCHQRRISVLLRPKVLDRLPQFDPKLICHEVLARCGLSVCCVCLSAVWTRPIRRQRRARPVPRNVGHKVLTSQLHIFESEAVCALTPENYQ